MALTYATFVLSLENLFSVPPNDVGFQQVLPNVIDEADIPTDRTFRDAWRHGSDGKVAVHMPTAVEIHKERMRQARAPLLNALDVGYAKADEKGDIAAKSIIAAKKQALRDVTKLPALLGAKTPDDLLAITVSST